MSAEASEEGIRVFVRIRPLNKREIADKQTIGWDFNSTDILEDTQNGQRVYSFDRCYSPDEKNKEVYDLVGKPVILKAMEGYNGTVFTYGQTGSGKTFTMRGCDDDPGMMLLCINDIFDFIDSKKKDCKYTLKIAYMEVYNEEINDLLGEGPESKNLRIVSEDSIKGAVIGNLTEVVVDNPLEMLEVLRKGEISRSYGSTTMNAESSRSHTIYRISIESVEIDSDTDIAGVGRGVVAGVTRLSFMNLVDLAGSERQKSTNTSGKALKEGANINKSLLALGAVINKLGEASKKAKGAKTVFLPYRDSKLTRILKQSLGGNTMTSILCTITPAPMHREETVSTLKFGQLCKTIKNTVKSNEVVDDRMLMRQYKATIQELRQQVNTLEDAAESKASTVDHAVVSTLKLEKTELESKVATLEALVRRGTNALEEISTATVSSSEMDRVIQELRASQATNISLQEELTSSKKMIRQCNKNIADLELAQASLEADLGSLNDFDEMKNGFETYQERTQAEIDEKRLIMAAEKDKLQEDRSLTMAEKTHLDEKEGRLGLLLAALDERESKLRHHLNTLKEQEGHWEQSIEDLTRREELVEEWQSNHRGREKKLQDWDASLEQKFADLSKREAGLVESEHDFKALERGLGEREQRLQVALSRVAHTEQAVSSLEKKLADQENTLKVRESELDVKEREIVARKRELEQWDSLIREKDRKVVVEQGYLEKREGTLRNEEEKVRVKEEELDIGLLEVRQRESDVKIEKDRYASQLLALESRERIVTDQEKEANNLSGSLILKEEQLKSKETRLNEMEILLQDTNARTEEVTRREAEHDKAVDQFFNHDIASITSRHAKELNDLEELIQRQLVSVTNFQTELDKVKEINQKISQEKNVLEEELSLKTNVLQEMQEEVGRLEEERESLKQEAEEERKVLAKGQTSKETNSSPRSSRTSEQDDGGGACVSDSNGNNFSSKMLANRPFLVQLADTQAMLKAVLDAQTRAPSTSFLREGSTPGYSGMSGGSSLTLAPKEDGVGRGEGRAGEYPQPSREDIQNMIRRGSDDTVEGSGSNTDVSVSMSHQSIAQSTSSGAPQSYINNSSSDYKRSTSAQSSGRSHSADSDHLHDRSQHHRRGPTTSATTSHISDSALRKLGGSSASASGREKGESGSRELRGNQFSPGHRLSKFDVTPVSSPYPPPKSHSLLQISHSTPTRDRDRDRESYRDITSRGGTPVVSVELSLNRSGSGSSRSRSSSSASKLSRR